VRDVERRRERRSGKGCIDLYPTSAFGTFLFRQFFLTTPRDFEEAARLDGATRWQVLWHIIVPLAKPAIAVWRFLPSLVTGTIFSGH